jgi:hypothetical protein
VDRATPLTMLATEDIVLIVLLSPFMLLFLCLFVAGLIVSVWFVMYGITEALNVLKTKYEHAKEKIVVTFVYVRRTIVSTRRASNRVAATPIQNVLVPLQEVIIVEHPGGEYGVVTQINDCS